MLGEVLLHLIVSGAETNDSAYLIPFSADIEKFRILLWISIQ